VGQQFEHLNLSQYITQAKLTDAILEKYLNQKYITMYNSYIT